MNFDPTWKQAQSRPLVGRVMVETSNGTVVFPVDPALLIGNPHESLRSLITSMYGEFVFISLWDTVPEAESYTEVWVHQWAYDDSIGEYIEGLRTWVPDEVTVR